MGASGCVIELANKPTSSLLSSTIGRLHFCHVLKRLRDLASAVMPYRRPGKVGTQCVCAPDLRESSVIGIGLQVQEKGARPPRTGLARNVLSKYFLTDPSNLSTYAVMKASAPG